jgi:hypothetical protein
MIILIMRMMERRDDDHEHGGDSADADKKVHPMLMRGRASPSSSRAGGQVRRSLHASAGGAAS